MTELEHDIVDLRSDTLTQPTPAMRHAMANAEVGDDQYGEDPTVRLLEERVASLLGKEAAVFMPSGVMGNLTAILAHAERGSEMILGDAAHILWYEGAAPAAVGGVSPRTIHNNADGTFDLNELRESIRTVGPGYPRTSVIAVESSHNRCGGTAIPLDHMAAIHEIAQERGVPVHLDGARIWNAAAALGVPESEIARHADTVQCALSKGLAAPVGSLVAGSADVCASVRIHRKVVGGAMRQSGVLAAAGLIGLETMRDRLPDDHARASALAESIAAMDGLSVDLDRVQTNIVIMKPDADIDQSQLIAGLKARGVYVSDFGNFGIRLVTHYQITDDLIDAAIAVIGAVISESRGTVSHA